jgi:hypothetical protein
MRMITDPPLMLDLTAPEVATAIARIRMEMHQVEHEDPTLTPLQALQVARSRCAQHILAAINAIDGPRARTGPLSRRWRGRPEIWRPPMLLRPAVPPADQPPPIPTS